jgi:phospholipid/cholesterol/gamma-HCH transport system ATP-binding protein
MIEILDLKKSFGPKMVLDGVSMQIPNGKTTCIIGRSGSGKSVLLKHIVRLLEPDSGKVTVDGKDVSSLTYSELFDIRQTMGFVFQGAALFDSYTVFQNVVISLYEHGQKDWAVLEQEAKRVLSAVGLLPDLSLQNTEKYEKEWKILKDKKPSDLSGGMRKRVGVARALVGSPKYIFYDEPTTGLDPVTSEQIDELIADLAEKLKVTSVVITHDMFSVYRIADNVIMIADGKVVFDGDVPSLRSSKNSVVVEFIERFS